MRRARSTLWLLLLLMALAGVAVTELQNPVGAGAGRQGIGGEVPAQDPPVALFSLDDRESFADTLARPLFMPNRRPAAAEVAQAPAPTTQPARPSANRYALSAIIIVDNERIALLTDTATGGLSRVREGDSFAGWQMESIRADGAVISNGDTREELSLRTFAPPVPRPPRPTAVPVPGQSAGSESERLPNRPRRPKRGLRRPLTVPRSAAN